MGPLQQRYLNQRFRTLLYGSRFPNRRFGLGRNGLFTRPGSSFPWAYQTKNTPIWCVFCLARQNNNDASKKGKRQMIHTFTPSNQKGCHRASSTFMNFFRNFFTPWQQIIRWKEMYIFKHPCQIIINL